jgi:hypothetical protein
MANEHESLTRSAILAMMQALLADNGFRTTRDAYSTSFPKDRTLLAEDDFSVLAIVTYDTWTQLLAEWLDAQAELTSLLNNRLARSAPKGWDGYLVLVCMGSAQDTTQVSSIEQDTTRVRKLVATADTLRTSGEVAHFLDVFLPIAIPESDLNTIDVLDSLPELLKEQIQPDVLREVISAFRNLESPLERLHQLEAKS